MCGAFLLGTLLTVPAVARLLAITHKLTHIINFRIQYKSISFMYRALYGQAPAYLMDRVFFYCLCKSLQSVEGLFLAVPHTRLKTKKGDRALI